MTGIFMTVFGSLALLSILLFFLFGLDKKISPIAKDTPPDGISSAGADFVLGGQSSAGALPPLIVYWASKGYLTLSNINEAGTDELELIKKKDPDSGTDPHEKELFERLFYGRSAVPFSELKSLAATRPNNLKLEFADAFAPAGSGFFTKASVVTATLCCLLAALCAGVLPVITAINDNLSVPVGIGIGIVAFILTVFFCGFLRFSAIKPWSKKGFFIRAAIYIAVLLLLSGLSGFTLLAFVSALSALVCGLSCALSKKHTAKGRAVYEELLGLRAFITAEHQNLSEITAKSPFLFYDLLPFAFALDCADSWTERFKKLVVAKPVFLESNTPGLFDPIFMTNLLSMRKQGTGENAFAIGAFAGHKGFESGSRTRIP